MLKQELIKKIADKSGLSQKAAGAVLESFMETVITTLAAKDKVYIMGFGTFEMVERAARKGRNVKTGEEMFLPARLSPKFRAVAPLKNAIAIVDTKAKAS